MQGKRTLADHLDLGLFTQDLAQELPLDREALGVVLEHAQKKDPTILAEVSSHPDINHPLSCNCL
jgi:hypothetical protein